MNQDFIATIKDNWLIILIALVVFGFLVYIYPHTDMGKMQVAESELINRSNAIFYYQMGMLSPQDKQWYMENLGMTEADFNPVRQWIEKGN